MALEVQQAQLHLQVLVDPAAQVRRSVRQDLVRLKDLQVQVHLEGRLGQKYRAIPLRLDVLDRRARLGDRAGRQWGSVGLGSGMRPWASRSPSSSDGRLAAVLCARPAAAALLLGRLPCRRRCRQRRRCRPTCMSGAWPCGPLTAGSAPRTVARRGSRGGRRSCKGQRRLGLATLVCGDNSADTLAACDGGDGDDGARSLTIPFPTWCAATRARDGLEARRRPLRPTSSFSRRFSPPSLLACVAVLSVASSFFPPAGLRAGALSLRALLFFAIFSLFAGAPARCGEKGRGWPRLLHARPRREPQREREKKQQRGKRRETTDRQTGA